MPDPVTGHCQAGPCADVRVRIQRVTGAGGIKSFMTPAPVEQAAGALAVLRVGSYPHIQRLFLKRSFYILFKTFLAPSEARAGAACRPADVTICPYAVTDCPQNGG